MKYFRTRCPQPVLLALCLSAVCGTAKAAENIVEVADKSGTFKTLLLVYWVMHDGTRKQWRGEIAPGTLDVCERT